MSCVLITAGSVQAAVNAYLELEGVKQGKFKSAGATDNIAITDFSYQAATGMASGKRQHGTITIVREVDKASPQFASAAASGEVLSNIEIDFVHPGVNGASEVYKTLNITAATISSIKHSSGGDRPVESITFSFETENMVAKNKNGGKSAMDDWLAQK
jgi:type VI secretion system secreted protein Hcp